MSDILRIHRKAMEWAEEGQFMLERGDQNGARAAFFKAMELERDAAHSIDQQIEPDRSVLLRSAASLAIDCDELRIAEQLLATGLSGDPPPVIADEIRDLLEQVNFRRHLSVRGIQLEDNDVQLSLSGAMVGFGVASSDEFLNRVRDLSALVLRTAERMLGRPYREGGSPQKRLRDEFGIFLSAPRPASFAVTLKLGWPRQYNLWDSDREQGVIGEVLDLLEMVQNQDTNELAHRIQEPPYMTNFSALVKKLAPDGKNVSLVGLTTRLNTGESREVALTTRRSEISLPASREDHSTPDDEPRRFAKVTGVLHYADAIGDKHTIRLEDENKSVHEIIVPQGMMADIVRPLWDDVVTVTGTRRGKRIELEEILPFEE